MKCKICNNELIKININNVTHEYCLKCLFLSKDKNYILSDYENRKRYLLHSNDDAYINYMHKLYFLIKPYIIGERILDFGCGYHKILTNILKENNYQVHYYDKYFFDIDYKNSRYDTIILIEVIEHITEPLTLLKDLKQLLNNKGRIIIQTNLHNESFNNWWYLRDSTHVSFFNDKTFVQIAKIINLEVNIIKSSNLIILTTYN